MAGGAASRSLALVLAALATAACGARLPPRPAGAAVPSPEAVTLLAALTAHCQTVRTVTAVLALGGRAGGERLRGRLAVGLAAGGDARLEAVAPFGPPLFVLAGRAETATLLFPRERAVVLRAPLAEVIERLIGVPLGADTLRAVLTACPGAGEFVNGRAWSADWRAVSTADGRTLLLRRRAGAWGVAAVESGTWQADYGELVNGRPRHLRVRTLDGRVDIDARVEQFAVNVTLAESAFTVAVPDDAERLALDDLRPIAPFRQP